MIKTLIPEWKLSKYKYLENQEYGRWTIICAYKVENYKIYVKVKCICGNENIVRLDLIKSGESSSCGCFNKERIKESNTIHGLSQTSLYHTYHNAKNRCTNINHPKYKDYGGRGIKFLFESFEDFVKELGDKPTPKHEVDRKFNNGHYEIGNIRWATRKEQNNNTRKQFS